MSMFDAKEACETLNNQSIGIERNRAQIAHIEQDLATLTDQLGTQAAFLRAVRTRLLGEIFHAEQLVQEIKRLLIVDAEHRNQQADVIIQRLQLMVADPNSDIAHVAQQSGIDTMRLMEISESRMITAKELRQLTSVEY